MTQQHSVFITHTRDIKHLFICYGTFQDLPSLLKRLVTTVLTTKPLDVCQYQKLSAAVPRIHQLTLKDRPSIVEHRRLKSQLHIVRITVVLRKQNTTRIPFLIHTPQNTLVEITRIHKHPFVFTLVTVHLNTILFIVLLVYLTERL